MPSLEQQPVYGQRQQQTQKLALSAEMRQALDVLRMPLDELREYIGEKTLENPLLEMEPSAPAGEEGVFSTLALPDETLPGTAHQIWEERVFAGEIAPAAGPAEADFERLAARQAGETLADALREELAGLKLDALQQDLCEYLVECLDRRGYLRFTLEELAGETGASVFDLEQALYILQSLHPAGVAARTLEECLVLQLVRGPHFNACTLKLAKQGLPLLAEGDTKGLAALLGCPVAEAARWAAAVQALNPIPAQGYAGGDRLAQIIPDAAVERDGAGFRVVMNHRALPTPELNGEYVALAGQQPGEAGAYLSGSQAAAQSLITAVAQRKSTLLRIITCLVQKQPAFFEDGQTLTPMAMAEVADELGLHVSTVSRAIQHKYVVCAAGTVALKSLFTAGVGGSGGPVSSAMACQKIRQCIGAESKQAPLSDEDIRLALAAMGIALSRRTVAKYREGMGIPSSARRRRA